MSFDTALTLKNASAESENFVRLNGDSSKTTYALDSATLQEPVLFSIAHTMTSAREGSDRHLVKVSRTMLDTEGKAFTAVINCTLSVPRLGITATHVNDCIAELKEFLSAGNVAKLLRGEL